MPDAPPIRIDLVSDTSTRPTAGMRRAIAEANVGDEQRGEDPTVNALCARVAELLGKEDALFLPSGIMCNQVAILVHCRPGDEIIAAENSHIVGSEGAGAAALAGAQIRTVATADGIFDGDAVTAAARAPRPKSPRSRLVNVEQTSNRGGGAVWPLETIEAVAGACRANDLALHMDGARLMNAVVASGIAAERYAAPCDSVWLDLSKGLGCPVGGVLAGSKAFVEEAWVRKYRLGGGMRQTGILAAAGLYALDHHVERLAEDHENARLLGDRLRSVPGIVLDPPEIATNLVFFDVAGTGLTADAMTERLLAQGIRVGVQDETRMRAVTHLDVNRAGVEAAADAIAGIIADAATRRSA